MQILDRQLSQFQFSTTNSLSGEVQILIPKTKKIIKNKKQSISKQELKNYLLSKSKFKKSRAAQKSLKARLSSFNKNFQEFQFEKDSFYCPICIQLLIQPIVTECGHALCQKCLQNLIQYNPRCPVCRLQIELCEMNVDKNLNNLILKFASQNYADCILQYERTQQNFEWLQKKRSGLQKLQHGQYIDIKCISTKKWTQGCIADIRVKKQNKQAQFCVSYTTNGESTKQWIGINSSRLACHSFFTGKKSSKHQFQALSFFDNLQSVVGVNIDVELDRQEGIQRMDVHGQNQIAQKNENEQTGYQNKESDITLNQLLNEESTNFWGEVDFL